MAGEDGTSTAVDLKFWVSLKRLMGFIGAHRVHKGFSSELSYWITRTIRTESIRSLN